MDSYPPSLLDKLLGTRAASYAGTAPRWTVEQVKDSVARDIEMLLNAHRHFSADDLEAFPLAAKSLLTLGLVDIASMSLSNDGDRQRIKTAIRDSLTAHDRRLSNVEVGLRLPGTTTTSLAFTIRAELVLKPNVARVVFDAVLHPGSKRYDVSEADHRAVIAAG